MARTPLLSDLREPPVVGRFYMVPVVRDYPYGIRVGDWPVLGPLHEDAEHFKFAVPHYHLDLRFLSKSDFKFIARQLPDRLSTRDAAADAVLQASGGPLNNIYKALPKGRPTLLPRRCHRVGLPPTTILHHHVLAGDSMRASYGEVAEPVRRRDGRALCPHRKLDLSPFTPDADGIVTCPLHGLRVRCAVPA